jgi:hypothetical protein
MRIWETVQHNRVGRRRNAARPQYGPGKRGNADCDVGLERFDASDVLRLGGEERVTGDGVSSPDELRSYAVDCGRLARSASDPRDKARLLNMARAWAELADRIEKIGQGGATLRTGLPDVSVPVQPAGDQQEAGEP